MSQASEALRTKVIYLDEDPAIRDLETLPGPVVSGEVDGVFMFGTQRPEDYVWSQRKRVDSVYRNSSRDELEAFYRNNPLIVCPIPLERSVDMQVLPLGTPVQIALLEGHNRFRFSPQNKRVWKANFLTPLQGAWYTGIDPERYLGFMRERVGEILDLFLGRNPNLTVPRPATLHRVDNQLQAFSF